MTSDISRESFNPKDHYTKVVIQQGRVILDSDLNEQTDIQNHYNKSYIQDIIGKSGTNKNNKGFKIIQDEKNPLFYNIINGRYYVDGILCENEEKIRGNEQPDLVSFPPIGNNMDYTIATDIGYYIAYLDVWERNINFLNDARIRESALGGPDTSTRDKTIWQIKLHKVDKIDKHIDHNWALSILEDQLIKKNKGKISVTTLNEQNNNEDDNNDGGEYTGEDNTLFRIQIHNGGDLASNENDIRYKWSKDNATVVFKVNSINEEDNSISINAYIKDKKYSLKPGDWIEITDDRHELWSLPGVMAKLSSINSSDQGLDIVIDTDTIWYNENDNYYIKNDKGNVIIDQNFSKNNPIVKKWDYFNLNIKEDNKKIQEDLGISIEFYNEGFLNSGDYWLIPARTNTKDIDWPKDPDEKPMFCEPKGIHHSYSPIALIQYKKGDQICNINNINNNKDSNELDKLKNFIEKTFDENNANKNHLENKSINSGNKDIFIYQFGDDGQQNYRFIYDDQNKIAIFTQNDNLRLLSGFIVEDGNIYQNQIEQVIDLRNLFENITDLTFDLNSIYNTTGIAKIKYDIEDDEYPVYGRFKHFLNVKVPPAIILGVIEYINHKETISFIEGFPHAFLNVKAVLIDNESFCISLVGSNKDKLKEQTDNNIFNFEVRWWAFSSFEKQKQEMGLIEVDKNSVLGLQLKGIKEHAHFLNIFFIVIPEMKNDILFFLKKELKAIDNNTIWQEN